MQESFFKWNFCRVDITFTGNHSDTWMIGLCFYMGFSCLIVDFPWKYNCHNNPSERVAYVQDHSQYFPEFDS